MIRYRFGILMACVLASLLFLGAWRAADSAPGVLDAGEGLSMPLDDSAIYFQYAHQALQGEWLRYNPGAALSTGVTSPLYFLLLTALMGLGLSGPLAAWALAAASLLLGVIAMDAIGRRLFTALPAWWPAFLLLSQGAWMAWSFNGMETGTLMALSLCAVLAWLGTSRAWFLLAIGGLAFTRPEGQVLALLLALTWGYARADAKSLLLGAFLSLAPSLLLNSLCGSLTPDSLRPKTAALLSGMDAWSQMAQSSDYAVGLLKGAFMGAWSGQDLLGTAGNAAAQNPASQLFPPLLLVAALLGCFAQDRRPVRGLWLAVAAALAGIGGLLSWELPVGWNSHRYLAACAPLLWLAGLAGLNALRASRGLPRAAAAALFSLWSAFGLASWPWNLQRTHRGAAAYAGANRNSALLLRALPAGPVAVVDAGLLAYYSGHPIVDLLGITDHSMALAQADGKGAVLEAMLARKELPRWAALHRHRPDFDLATWVGIGLLRPLPLEAGQDMGFYAWDWSGAPQRSRPARVPAGWTVVGGINVADLADEAAAAYRPQGERAQRTRLTNLRLSPSEAQVPEGGRIASMESFDRKGQALMLRAVFDRAGSLRIRSADGHSLLFAAVAASPSEHYSEILLPLPPDAPERVFVTFEDEKGQPSDWSSCRYWFLEPAPAGR